MPEISKKIMHGSIVTILICVPTILSCAIKTTNSEIFLIQSMLVLCVAGILAGNGS